MDFKDNFSRIAFTSVLFLYIFGGGLIIYKISMGSPGFTSSHFKNVEQAKTQGVQPVTDCFESMEGYTSVGRIENIVPQYGYPNVKCSQITSAVLWYGDPYDGTQPMGDMPKLKGKIDKWGRFQKDDSHGAYETEEAVIKPREPALKSFECIECHDGDSVPVPEDKKPRALEEHQDIIENSLQMMHGRGAIWCLDCHSAKNRNKLVDHQGNEISFDQPQKLCGSCHGTIYNDWRAGIHGKRTGSWVTGGKKRWWLCTECHSPHAVQADRFNPLKPEPAPALPRGMDHVHEGHEGEGHEGSEHGSPQESESASAKPSKEH